MCCREKLLNMIRAAVASPAYPGKQWPGLGIDGRVIIRLTRFGRAGLWVQTGISYFRCWYSDCQLMIILHQVLCKVLKINEIK
jgi:hypothetical protein